MFHRLTRAVDALNPLQDQLLLCRALRQALIATLSRPVQLTLRLLYILYDLEARSLPQVQQVYRQSDMLFLLPRLPEPIVCNQRHCHLHRHPGFHQVHEHDNYHLFLHQPLYYQ